MLMEENNKEKFTWRKFFVKGATRLAYRAIEILILVGMFYAFGFRLPIR